jgi:hypothetical protein
MSFLTAKTDTMMQLPQWAGRNDDQPHSSSEKKTDTWDQVLLPTDLHFLDRLVVLQRCELSEMPHHTVMQNDTDKNGGRRFPQNVGVPSTNHVETHPLNRPCYTSLHVPQGLRQTQHFVYVLYLRIQYHT